MSVPATEALGPLDRARIANERFIAILAASIAGFSLLLTATRYFDAAVGPEVFRLWGVVLVEIVVGTYYGYVFLTTRRPPRTASLWFRSTLEVSSVTAVMIIEERLLGAHVALTTGASYVVLLAVVVSALRLDPSIAIYAAALAFVQQVTFYFAVRNDPTLENVFVGFTQVQIFRWFVLLLGGLLGVVLSRTLRREVAAAEERARIRAAFGSYVDPRVVDAVLAGQLTMQAQRRTVTVLFVDIRGFTALSETTDPARVFKMLDEALDAFATEVQKQGGIVNKFLGDGLMALFGAPEEQADHPRRAVRAALQIEAAAQRLAVEGRFPGLKVGVGVHCGEAVVGDIGRARREYTAVGDVVNVAARVEQANKELGTTILITEAVRHLVGGGAELRVHPPLTLRGRMEKVEVYEVRGLRGTGVHDAHGIDAPVGADAVRTPPSSPA